jgi:acetyl-CoA C-acetyltransferase
MWAQVVDDACEDSGAGTGRVLRKVDSLAVLYCQSWPYDDPAARLSGALGINPARSLYSGIGGTTPHLLLAEASSAIASGDLDVALVVSGEALETIRQFKKAGERPQWSYRDPVKRPFPFEEPFHPSEVAHSVFQAWLTFAVFDIARRAHLGVAPATYRSELGRLLAPMTAVAEANPNAWFRQRHTPEDLIEPTPANRMVGYPYTKAMVAIMDVDMAAAVVMASEQAADSLGVPPDRRVYPKGFGYATDPVYVAEHDPLWASPAMARASAEAFTACGAGVDDVAHFDLYSCFGSSLNLAIDALGLSPADPRGLTVTGGLPFAGGPGSGYVLHGTAEMVGVLRADPGSLGMVSGVGMHMTKHAFGLYSTKPPANPAYLEFPSGSQGQPVPNARPIASSHNGEATIAAYTVVHERSGEPGWGLVVCDVPGGARAYGRVEDPAWLSDMETEEWVGTFVRVRAGEDGVNRVVSVERERTRARAGA